MESKVKGPAIATMIAGIAGMVLCLMYGGMIVFGMSIDREEILRGDLPPQLRQLVRESMDANPIWESLWAGFSFLVYAFITFAGTRMLQMRSWMVALVSSILLLIPCFTPCCCTCGLTLGIGVWSLIVLLDQQVKQAFKP